LQWPLFSQDGQKWLPSTNSSWTIMRRSALSSAVSLCTSAPAFAGWVQEVACAPLIFTVQSLQLPCGRNSGW
jgi:hypothetical protein